MGPAWSWERKKTFLFPVWIMRALWWTIIIGKRIENEGLRLFKWYCGYTFQSVSQSEKAGLLDVLHHLKAPRLLLLHSLMCPYTPLKFVWGGVLFKQQKLEKMKKNLLWRILCEILVKKKLEKILKKLFFGDFFLKFSILSKKILKEFWEVVTEVRWTYCKNFELS